MKVALLTEYEKIGGGEKNLLNLADELKKHIDVTLFCSGDVKKEAISRGIKVVDFKIENSRHWLKFIPIVRYKKDLINQLNKFDIVHAYSLNVLPYLFFVKTKKVWTNHGYWEHPFGLRAKIIDKLVDKVITVSTDVDNISEFRPSKKTKILLGTDFCKKCKNFGIDKNSEEIIISCIARFQRIKGQDLLIKALEKLQTLDIQKIKVYFVGDVNSNNEEDVEFKNEVLALSKKINSNKIRIYFEGFKENIVDYIKQSDFIVIPSRYESFGMVAIESLVCQKPIVAPNIGGLKDILIDKSFGLLFEPNSIEDLYSKLLYMIKNRRKFIINRESVKRFCIENQAKKHLELYKSLLI